MNNCGSPVPGPSSVAAADDASDELGTVASTVDPLLATDDGASHSGELKFPAPMRRRGRPKGHDTTVIGLRKRGSKQTSFAKMCANDKRKMMLLWLFGNSSHDVAGPAYRPPELPVQFRDDQVLSVINLVKDYVDVAYVKSQVSSALLEWTCSVCANAFAADDNSVSCDSCLLWVHFSCANLKRAPAKKEWYCKLCRQAAP